MKDKWRPAVPAIIMGVCLLAAMLPLHQDLRRLKKSLAASRDEVGKLSDIVQAMHAANQQLTGVVESMIVANQGGDPASIAYVETPRGLVPAPANRGISRDELDFLRAFRGPILDAESKMDEVDVYNSISSAIRDGAMQHAEELQTYQFTPRQTLIAYSLLRTNGSFVTYEVRHSIPNDPDLIIKGPSGSCADYALRLTLVLDAIDVDTAIFSINTPSFPGHVVVDAYDSEEDSGYILDPNFNTMIIVKNTGGRSGMYHIIERFRANGDVLDGVRIVNFPVYFRHVDPSDTGYFDVAMNVDTLNEQRGGREKKWKQFFRAELQTVMNFWSTAPGHAPQSLSELAKSIDKIPPQFQQSGEIGRKLRQFIEATSDR